ncbi:MAG: hypothetical protein MJK14_26160, partial [Rivularia sp. ALOHA_DT_140]|nr:hypothetical protein [Rivularia sp. ALOHA_DT_140]
RAIARTVLNAATLHQHLLNLDAFALVDDQFKKISQFITSFDASGEIRVEFAYPNGRGGFFFRTVNRNESGDFSYSEGEVLPPEAPYSNRDSPLGESNNTFGVTTTTESQNSSDKPSNPDSESIQRQLVKKEENNICSSPNSTTALNATGNNRRENAINNQPCKTFNDNKNILKLIPDNRFNDNSSTLPRTQPR